MGTDITGFERARREAEKPAIPDNQEIKQEVKAEAPPKKTRKTSK